MSIDSPVLLLDEQAFSDCMNWLFHMRYPHIDAAMRQRIIEGNQPLQMEEAMEAVARAVTHQCAHDDYLKAKEQKNPSLMGRLKKLFGKVNCRDRIYFVLDPSERPEVTVSGLDIAMLLCFIHDYFIKLQEQVDEAYDEIDKMDSDARE